METLKFSVWQLLIEAMALTSAAALIALVGSMLLARSLARLSSFERVYSASDADENAARADQLFTARLKRRSY